MRIKDEFEIRECFETEPGCPTLTIVQQVKETMIPWNRFSVGEFARDKVLLHFSGKLVVSIRGSNLEEVWRAAQMNDLRLIRVSQESDNGRCRILALVIEEPKEEEEEVCDEDEIPF
ncbi:hypothetical protein AAFN60_18630 [Roseibacillus persicicus]|uniref:hypothetical protein n=1 Tax=Roseibacillus persicicus TaxID=454148 RepID=UPI00398AAA9A